MARPTHAPISFLNMPPPKPARNRAIRWQNPHPIHTRVSSGKRVDFSTDKVGCALLAAVAANFSSWLIGDIIQGMSECPVLPTKAVIPSRGSCLYSPHGLSPKESPAVRATGPSGPVRDGGAVWNERRTPPLPMLWCYWLEAQKHQTR